MANPVVHFEVLGKDAKGLQSFYGDVFGWEMDSVMDTYAMARPGGDGGIEGGVGSTPDGSSGHVTFYVAVPDLEATLNQAENRGGKRLMGPMDVPNGPTIALFSDPEGHVVGLVDAASTQS